MGFCIWHLIDQPVLYHSTMCWVYYCKIHNWYYLYEYRDGNIHIWSYMYIYIDPSISIGIPIHIYICMYIITYNHIHRYNRIQSCTRKHCLKRPWSPTSSPRDLTMSQFSSSGDLLPLSAPHSVATSSAMELPFFSDGVYHMVPVWHEISPYFKVGMFTEKYLHVICDKMTGHFDLTRECWSFWKCLGPIFFLASFWHSIQSTCPDDFLGGGLKLILK